MPSILDKHFLIPHIYATGYIKTFDSGANAPILAGGIDMHSNKKGEFVIKLKAGETMKDPSANLKELLAAFIAMEIDIPVIQPVLMEVTQPFVETVTNALSKKQATKSLGLNFGSVYIDGYATITTAPLSDKLLPFAQRLFAFDMLIQNVDRTIEKPNMLTNGEEIIALDHEKAFSFIFVLFSSTNLWELSTDQRKWITQHVLLPYINGKKFDFDGFMDKCAILTPEFWNKAWQLTPEAWRTEDFNTIKERLSSFISHRKEFIKELKIIMS